MKKFLSMAVLALVVAVMTGCSNEDDSLSNPPQPENTSKTVTLTTTVGLDGGTTRALTAAGVKTFAAGDQIAVIYTKNGGKYAKAVSEALPTGSYGANATFTVTLDDPDRTRIVTYIYPAAMAGETSVDYTKLNSQVGGTLDDLGSKYDLCTKSGSWNGDNLPTLTLENQLAILAITLKNSDGSSDITSTITGMTISEGTNSYTVTRSAAVGPIYVAIRPTTSAAIDIIATAGSTFYAKSLTSKTYKRNNGYNVSWMMTALSEGALPGKFTIYTGKKVRFSKGNLRAKYKNDVWSWSFSPNQWNYVGNASNNTNITGNGTVSAGGELYVDLFGWVGASSTWTGAAMYGISNSTTKSDYGNVAKESLKSDWGNVEGIGTGWFTMNMREWDHLLSWRTDAALKYGHGSVNGVNGLIILPDTWTLPTGLTFTAGNSAWANSYTIEQWSQMEAAGAVFLPAAGSRNGISVSNAGTIGNYYSSSCTNSTNAYRMAFNSETLYPNASYDRYVGMSVRLVREVE